MAKLSKVKVDPKAEIDGVWCEYVLDIRVKIARIGNREYDAAIRSMSKPYTKGFRADRVPDEAMQDIVKKAVAKHIVKDWENIEDDDGSLIPYSPEAALEIFQNDEYRDFYKFVLACGNDAELFRRENMEEAKGN